MSQKALCVCKSGNVRSVTLARMLKKRGYQALTLGAEDFARGDDSDLEIALSLCAWADLIFCQRDAERYLLEIMANNPEMHEKIDLRFDVGPDDWKIPNHPDLFAEMRAMVQTFIGSGSSV